MRRRSSHFPQAMGAGVTDAVGAACDQDGARFLGLRLVSPGPTEGSFFKQEILPVIG